jgi:tRNA G18 (ribose-2'-O)-methylase SpoU
MRKTVTIASPSNPRVKQWRRTLSGQVRKSGITLVAGQRIIAELLGRVEDGAWWVAAEDDDSPLPGPESIPVARVARALFKELDLFGTRAPLLEVPIPDWAHPPKLPLPAGLHVVVPNQDPRNVGAIIRSAAGLGAAAVHLLPSAANPFHPLTVRASVGAVFSLPLYALPDLSLLVGAGVPLLALNAGGPDISTLALPETALLLVGLEGPGTHPLLATGEPDLWRRVSLPMVTVESYNAGVAAAMAMYEWRRQHPFPEPEA